MRRRFLVLIGSCFRTRPNPWCFITQPDRRAGLLLQIILFYAVLVPDLYAVSQESDHEVYGVDASAHNQQTRWWSSPITALELAPQRRSLSYFYMYDIHSYAVSYDTASKCESILAWALPRNLVIPALAHSPRLGGC